MKMYQWFYWTSNAQFLEKIQPDTGAPKRSYFVLQYFSWGPGGSDAMVFSGVDCRESRKKCSSC
jgi:hypothetical protein